MIITNRHNLPPVLVEALRNDDYSAGDSDVTVTQLLDAPRIFALKKKHKDELQQDVADMVWALCGQAMHKVLERANGQVGGLFEHRFYRTVLGWKLSGQIDHYCNTTSTLTDYKLTSAWTFKAHAAGEKKHWHTQLNVLSWLMDGYGLDVKRAQIVAILRDWSKMEAQRALQWANENNQPCTYPQSQIQILEIPLVTKDKTEAWVEKRVKLFQAAVESTPLCSDEDRWQKPDVYAVIKNGSTRALKLHPTKEAAETHASSSDALTVVHRRGEPTRCLLYCPASAVCSQFQQEKEKRNGV